MGSRVKRCPSGSRNQIWGLGVPGVAPSAGRTSPGPELEAGERVQEAWGLSLLGAWNHCNLCSKGMFLFCSLIEEREHSVDISISQREIS